MYYVFRQLLTQFQKHPKKRSSGGLASKKIIGNYGSRNVIFIILSMRKLRRANFLTEVSNVPKLVVVS